MRAIMIMFDTLTRNYLPNYGNNWVIAPNFQRLEEHCVTFDHFLWRKHAVHAGPA